MHEAVLAKLERRLGRLHAKLRLGIEMDHAPPSPGAALLGSLVAWYRCPAEAPR